MSVMTIPLRSQREASAIPRVNDLPWDTEDDLPAAVPGPAKKISAAAPAVRCTPIPTSSWRRG